MKEETMNMEVRKEETEKEKIDKKENKKTVLKFVLIMIVAMLAGAAVGAFSASVGEDAAVTIGTVAAQLVYAVAPYFTLVFLAVTIVTVAVIYSKCKKMYFSMQEENEDMIDSIENKLSVAMVFVSVEMITAMLFFAVCFDGFVKEMDGFTGAGFFICFFGSFVASLLYSILIQKKIVDFEKTLNPEKQGSVFDTKFADKWIASCDEAEQLMVYKSAYASYMAVSKTCILLWLVCLAGIMFWNFGMAPVFMVSVIWLVGTLSYCIKAMKLSKKKLPCKMFVKSFRIEKQSGRIDL